MTTGSLSSVLPRGPRSSSASEATAYQWSRRAALSEKTAIEFHIPARLGPTLGVPIAAFLHGSARFLNSRPVRRPNSGALADKKSAASCAWPGHPGASSHARIGRESQVREPGDCFTSAIIGEPLVVARDLAGELVAPGAHSTPSSSLVILQSTRICRTSSSTLAYRASPRIFLTGRTRSDSP